MGIPIAKTAGAAAELARMADQAADLGAVKGLPEPVRRAIMEQVERQGGLRCCGCDTRVTQGMRLRIVDIGEVEGQPAATIQVATCCMGGEGCDALERLKARATCMEPFELVWLDAPEGDESP